MAQHRKLRERYTVRTIISVEDKERLLREHAPMTMSEIVRAALEMYDGRPLDERIVMGSPFLRK